MSAQRKEEGYICELSFRMKVEGMRGPKRTHRVVLDTLPTEQSKLPEATIGSKVFAVEIRVIAGFRYGAILWNGGQRMVVLRCWVGACLYTEKLGEGWCKIEAEFCGKDQWITSTRYTLAQGFLLEDVPVLLSPENPQAWRCSRSYAFTCAAESAEEPSAGDEDTIGVGAIFGHRANVQEPGVIWSGVPRIATASDARKPGYCSWWEMRERFDKACWPPRAYPLVRPVGLPWTGVLPLEILNKIWMSCEPSAAVSLLRATPDLARGLWQEVDSAKLTAVLLWTGPRTMRISVEAGALMMPFLLLETLRINSGIGVFDFEEGAQLTLPCNSSMFAYLCLLSKPFEVKDEDEDDNGDGDGDGGPHGIRVCVLDKRWGAVVKFECERN